MKYNRLVERACVDFAATTSNMIVFSSERLFQRITPAAKEPSLNVVSFSQFSEDWEDQANRVFNEYRSRALPCWWFVGPNTDPKFEIENFLKKRGFQVNHEAHCLHLPVNGFKDNDPSHVKVEVVGGHNLNDFIDTRFDSDIPHIEIRQQIRMDILDSVETYGDRIQMFLAKIDDEPAGVGAFIVRENVVTLNGGFVRSKFRKQGVYRKLVFERVKAASNVGAADVVTLAKKNSSSPILSRLGFSTIGELKVFEWQPDRSSDGF